MEMGLFHCPVRNGPGGRCHAGVFQEKKVAINTFIC